MFTVHADIEDYTGYTFESIACHKGNTFAYTAASLVAKSPGRIYNPLVLVDETMENSQISGATQFLLAIGNEIDNRNPRKDVRFIQGSEFIATDEEEMGDDILTLKEYGNVDAILLDDVYETLKGKYAQRKLLVMLKNFIHTGRAIVIVISESPQKCTFMDPSLRDWLQAGIVTSICD